MGRLAPRRGERVAHAEARAPRNRRARHPDPPRDRVRIPTGIDLGSWKPFTVETVQALMRDAPVTWWLSGGYALDRFAGETIREHGDIDISVARTDWSAFLAHVDGMLECF